MILIKIIIIIIIIITISIIIIFIIINLPGNCIEFAFISRFAFETICFSSIILFVSSLFVFFNLILFTWFVTE